MTKKQKKMLQRILITLALFAGALILDKLILKETLPFWARLILYFLPYLLIGYDILRKALTHILHGQAFDENFLMAVATLAAFAIGEYPEALAVMLFYQIGELFQGIAVGKARAGITDLMSIAPESAALESEEGVTEVDPEDVEIGSVIVVRPGEKIPLDGVVLSGESFLDTSALTGESVPRRVGEGDAVISGCVNGAGTLRVQTTKRYEDSTVARILELVENAGNRKARLENSITRFARWYTPVVTIAALLLAVIPPLVMGGGFAEWIHRACIFLIVSCPCALVISVPLGFFGGIGAASRMGILVKGSNYLESAARIDRLVFDKTGTLTEGVFKVAEIEPDASSGLSSEALLSLAAAGEQLSTHPIALSILEALKAQGGSAGSHAVGDSENKPGLGLITQVDGAALYLGNEKLMEEAGAIIPEAALQEESAGTIVYAAREGQYLGYILIRDEIKAGAAQAMAALKEAGVHSLVMLSGDRRAAAEAVGRTLHMDEVHAELLPEDKVRLVEGMLTDDPKTALGYVGDGINDAPVLMRSDVGIAMGSLGSDAAIEAADIVLMDDQLIKLAKLIRIARKTLRIVTQNVIFALGVKLLVLILGALGMANLWEAVFGDVGVTVLAVLNSMRALRLSRKEGA